MANAIERSADYFAGYAEATEAAAQRLENFTCVVSGEGIALRPLTVDELEILKKAAAVLRAKPQGGSSDAEQG